MAYCFGCHFNPCHCFGRNIRLLALAVLIAAISTGCAVKKLLVKRCEHIQSELYVCEEM